MNFYNDIDIRTTQWRLRDLYIPLWWNEGVLITHNYISYTLASEHAVHVTR